ncbi:cpsA domain protein [Mycobacterium xenopi 4042]|uniref:CpsA domain protein n=1 Tax=Mycobacterium xenopi 4042 TaxID=1299334 RepID=X7ZY55_MYCXE|nr:cpsA domain protein [Mycobacterium xenopi 4042]
MARKDVVLSAGWDENQFRRMATLAGGNVEYRTLPVVRYENIDGQDVNIVDPPRSSARWRRRSALPSPPPHDQHAQPGDGRRRRQRQQRLRNRRQGVAHLA